VVGRCISWALLATHLSRQPYKREKLTFNNDSRLFFSPPFLHQNFFFLVSGLPALCMDSRPPAALREQALGRPGPPWAALSDQA
jgi:hypothetical protein